MADGKRLESKRFWFRLKNRKKSNYPQCSIFLILPSSLKPKCLVKEHYTLLLQTALHHISQQVSSLIEMDIKNAIPLGDGSLDYLQRQTKSQA